MNMARRNIIAGLAISAFGIWYAVQIQGLPERASMPHTPGPAFFPTVIAAALLSLSLAMAASGFMAYRISKGSSESRSVNWRSAAAILAFAAYLAAMPGIGFIISSAVFFAVLMTLYGNRSKIAIACFSIAIPVVVFALFRYGFQIILPRGLFSL